MPKSNTSCRAVFASCAAGFLRGGGGGQFEAPRENCHWRLAGLKLVTTERTADRYQIEGRSWRSTLKGRSTPPKLKLFAEDFPICFLPGSLSPRDAYWVASCLLASPAVGTSASSSHHCRAVGGPAAETRSVGSSGAFIGECFTQAVIIQRYPKGEGLWRRRRVRPPTIQIRTE